MDVLLKCRVIRYVDLLQNYKHFLISSVISGLLVQLQIFRQLYLMEWLGFLTVYLIYPRLLTGFGTLDFLINIFFGFLALLLHFLVILDGNFLQEFSIKIAVA